MLDLLVSPLFQIVALGIAGIVVWHLQGRSRPTARLLVQIAFFAAMTAILFANGISPLKFEPMREGGAMLIAAKTLWWVHLAWASIGFVRIYIVLDGMPREARVLQDLIIAAVYLAVTLSVLAFVFDFAIGTLLATSGVLAIILGLALQSTLNDLFSGLALTLGRPYGIGDWIILTDGTEGRVAESTWRSTHILTPANNIVVLPNSVLAKIGLTNVNRPDESHQLVLPLRVKPVHPPSFVVEKMRQAMIGANNIIHDPAPVVALKGIDAFAMDIELQFRVRHPSDRIPARNELIDLVYRQCIETGISLALPASSSVLVENIHTDHTLQDPLQELLQDNPIFADIEQDELHKLEVSAKLRQYRPGDIFFEGADSALSLMIVRSGAASALCDGLEVRRLAPGAIFGQIEGVRQATKYQALTVLEAYEIDGLTLASLFKDHPEIQNKLTQHLSGITGHGSATGSSRGEHASILRTVRGLLGK